MSKINRLAKVVQQSLTVILVIILMQLSGCSLVDDFVAMEEKYAFANERPDSYTVRAGDTLYSIAWELGLDNVELAQRNRINAPYLIFPGQVLRLSGPLPQVTSRSNSPVKKSTVSNNNTKNPAKLPAKKSHITPKTKVNSRQMQWSWPTDGRVIERFSTKKPVNKGIDIAGRLGDSVSAAAAGSVVYAGTGLRGYGKLVIIRHNDQFLSAYAHTSKILVEEGELVKVRQKIAEIGSTGSSDTRLHFEIRMDGQPINPMRFLPPR